MMYYLLHIEVGSSRERYIWFEVRGWIRTVFEGGVAYDIKDRGVAVSIYFTAKLVACHS